MRQRVFSAEDRSATIRFKIQAVGSFDEDASYSIDLKTWRPSRGRRSGRTRKARSSCVGVVFQAEDILHPDVRPA